ncbi:MAG: trypsin-like peptidase domain-containing protein [Anaerolineae bacterium]|nr:trypsin-like peptidase domain-containing protein [Anaerolineae bacterium]
MIRYLKSFRPVMLTVLVLSLASLACATPDVLQTLTDLPGLSSNDSAASDNTAAEPLPASQTSLTFITPTPLPQDVIAEADAEEQLLINLFQRTSPAVVSIDISQRTEDETLFDIGSGSGFVYDTEGHIVTNNHVVEDSDTLRVTMYDGTVFQAEVVGADPFSDLAVIRIDVPEEYTLIPVVLGDSDKLLVGQRVIAIGNPFGLSNTMTTGIVSGIGRTLPSGSFSNPLIIQTDAAINPGNSGGPLLNSNGEVVGVVTAIRSQTGTDAGVGFAVPVNTIARIAPQLIETGTVEYPYLGIQAIGEISLAELALEFDLPVQEGVLVTEVIEGTAADDAGLRGGDQTVNFRGNPIVLGGDIITAINDVPLNNFDELIGYLVSNTSVGDEVTVTIVRDGEVLNVPLTLGARP